MILRASNTLLLLLVGFAVFVSDSEQQQQRFHRNRIPPNAPNRRFAPQNFRAQPFRRQEGPVGPPRNFNFRPRGDIRRAPQIRAPAGPFAPPVNPPPLPGRGGAPPGGPHMPGLRPPKGVAMQLNLAKRKDFMSLGAFLLQRSRSMIHA